MADEQPQNQADGTPKIFKSMTGVIGGLTALVVALGGLYTAYDKLFPKTSTEGISAAKDGAVDAAQASTTQDEPPPLAQQQVRKSYTTGDGGTLAWVKGMWVWTDGNGNTYRYSEESNDGVTIVGKTLEDGKYIWIQWPAQGGEALQSFDDQTNWNQPVSVTVDQPAAE